MSDTDRPGTSDAQPPAPPPAAPAGAQAQAPAQEPPPQAYAAPVQQSFLDRALGMRAVIAVALAALVIGGLSGFILGEHTNGGDERFGPAGFPGGQHFPGSPQQGQQPFGQGQPMR